MLVSRLNSQVILIFILCLFGASCFNTWGSFYVFFCVNNREQGGPFSFLCSFATPSFIKPLVSLKAGILLLPKLSSECFILQFMELRKYDQFNTIPKIQKHHHLAVLLCYKCSYFISFFDTCPVVVKAPPTLQELNDPEESGCMAKKCLSGGPLFSAQGGSGPQQAWGGLQEAIRRPAAGCLTNPFRKSWDWIWTFYCWLSVRAGESRCPVTKDVKVERVCICVWARVCKCLFLWKPFECIYMKCKYSRFSCTLINKGHVPVVVLWESCRPGPLVNGVHHNQWKIQMPVT